MFVRLLQPTSVSNFPSHVISRATSQCWSQIKLDCQSMLQWLKHGKQILVERSGAGAGTEIKSIPLPLHGSCRILKLKSCFLFTILQFVNNTRNLEHCLDTETDNSELSWAIYNKDLLVEIELSSLVRLISSTDSQCLLCHSNWRPELLYFSAWNLKLRKASERN